jgi:hypothetical protein
MAKRATFIGTSGHALPSSLLPNNIAYMYMIILISATQQNAFKPTSDEPRAVESSTLPPTHTRMHARTQTHIYIYIYTHTHTHTHSLV